MDRRSLERWSVVFGRCGGVRHFLLLRVSVWVIPRYYSGELEPLGACDRRRNIRGALPVPGPGAGDSGLAHRSRRSDDGAGDDRPSTDLRWPSCSALGFRLLRRSGLALYSLPVGLYVAFLGTGLLYTSRSPRRWCRSPRDAGPVRTDWTIRDELGSGGCLARWPRCSRCVAPTSSSRSPAAFGVRWVQRRVRPDGSLRRTRSGRCRRDRATGAPGSPHARYPAGVPSGRCGTTRALAVGDCGSFLLPHSASAVAPSAASPTVVVSVLQRCSPLVGVIAVELALATVLGEDSTRCGCCSPRVSACSGWDRAVARCRAGGRDGRRARTMGHE